MAKEKAEKAYLASYDHVCGPANNQTLVSRIYDTCVQRAGSFKHLDNPKDPGVLYEICRSRLIAQVLAAKDVPEKKKLLEELQKHKFQLTNEVAAEVLREAAWLAAGQHGFAALAGLPELQQIIAYTCLPVLRKYACDMLDEQHLDDMYSTQQFAEINDGSQSLLDSLAPQLRVCLLAEVAAGLLCPGQPLPPDTLEHAAALLAFIDAAHLMLHEEIDKQHGKYLQWIANGSVSLAAALKGLQSESDATDTPLAPHVDLQLQPPPHVLLELFLLACCRGDVPDRTALQQRYQLDDVQMEGLVFLFEAGDHSLLWMHQIAKEVQEITDSSSTNQEVASSYSDVQGSSERPELPAQRLWHTFAHILESSCNPKVKQLIEQLPPAADSSSFASNLLQVLACEADSTDSVEDLAKLLRKLGGALVLQFLREAHAAGGTAWQQEVPLQVLVLLAAVEQLQGLVVAGVQQQDLQDSSSSFSAAQLSKPSLTASSSGSAATSAAAANGVFATGNGIAANGHTARTKINVLVSSSNEGKQDEKAGEECTMQQAAQQQQQQQQQQQRQRPPQPNLQAIVHKVASIVQLVRQFTAANTAVNAAATPNADGAAEQAFVYDGSALPPDVMFSAAGPLCQQHHEPCGWGIWAPAATHSSSSSSSSSSRTGQSAASPAGPEDWSWRSKHALTALAGAGVLATMHSDVHQEMANQSRQHNRWLRDQVCQHLNNWHRYGHGRDCDIVRHVCQQLGLHQLQPQHFSMLSKVPQVVAQVATDQGKILMQRRGLSGSNTLRAGLSHNVVLAQVDAQHRHRLLAGVLRGKEALEQLRKHWAMELWVPLQEWTKQQQQRRDAQVKQLAQSSSSTGSCNSSSSSSDGSSKLQASRHVCSLCQQEQQQQEREASTANAGAGPYTSWPVPYHDPFLWRRLLWQLLGRLKPSAQQWYAQEMNMCPHSDTSDGWHCVVASLKHHMWSSPEHGGLERSLLTCDDVIHHELECSPRAFFVKHYARAVNSAFCKSYDSPAAALLSQQVLLALSPLHLAEVPAQETAALCPSSFGPLVGKLLMQQLGLGQVLQDFSHKDVGQPSMWHAWWHIGIRRYHWVKQQQQAAGPRSAAATSSSTSRSGDNSSGHGSNSSSCAAAGLWRLSPAELEELYQDPDARYYAVGFAARQVHADTGHASSEECSRLTRTVKQLAEELTKLSIQTRIHLLQASNPFGTAFRSIDHNIVNAAHELAQRCGDREIIASMMLAALTTGTSSADSDMQHASPAYGMATHVNAGSHSASDVTELCSRLTECCDSGGMIRLALLSPCPAELWSHPSYWCNNRAHLMQDHMCSQCHESRVVGTERLYEVVEVAPPKGELHLCDSCGAFYFCSPECARPGLAWHQALCKSLTSARKFWSSSSSSCSTSTGSGCSLRGSGARASSSCSTTTVDGHRWQVLSLLQDESGPLQEPGPLGANCLALLQSRHRVHEKLVDKPLLLRKAKERSYKRRLRMLTAQVYGDRQLYGGDMVKLFESLESVGALGALGDW